MPDVIYVSKRTVERAVFSLIIIILAVLLVIKWNSEPVANDNSEELELLKAQVNNLTLEKELLEKELEQLKLEELLRQEAEKERENLQQNQDNSSESNSPVNEEESSNPESTLSGEVEVVWTITMDSEDPEKLDRVVVVIANGRDSIADINYKLYWEGFYEDKLYYIDDVTIKSGESATVIIEGSKDLTSNPTSGVDTLVLEIRDNEDNNRLIDKLSERVR